MKLKISKYKKKSDKRKVKLKTIPDDFFSLNSTLSMILVPLLEEYREQAEQCGCPFVEWVDVPEHFKDEADPTASDSFNEEGGFCLDAWLWIIDQMILGFEDIDEVTERYQSGEPKIFFEDIPGTTLKEMKTHPDSTYKFDHGGFDAYCEKMHQGRKLFAKYFNHLWL